MIIYNDRPKWEFCMGRLNYWVLPVSFYFQSRKDREGKSTLFSVECLRWFVSLEIR